MNIGIDLDGVIFDSENLWRTISVFFDIEISGKGMIKKDALLCQEAYGWDNSQAKIFLDKYLINGEKQAPVMPYAKYVIDELRKAGHKTYIITRRGYEDKKEITLTNKLLKKNKIKVDAIYYSLDNKLDTCKNLKLDLMIDDNLSIVETLANENIPCLHFCSVYSKKSNHHLITEVNNWGDIYREIFKTSR